MVAFAWRTRAAPGLHVSTLPQTVYGVARRCFKAARPAICFAGVSVVPVMQKTCGGPRSKVPVFRVLSFAEVLHTEDGPTGLGSRSGETGFCEWPKSFLEPTGFAAYRARRRWTTPRSTLRDALLASISNANMAQLMRSSAWTLANPVRTWPPYLRRVSRKLVRRWLSLG